MPKNSIQLLAELGQSVWLDNISRSLIETGQLEELIGLGLRGMTSNPTIFDHAISSSSDYDSRIQELARAGISAFDIYDEITVGDIRDAADRLRGVYESTDGLDGYVSLEVNPQLAYQTQASIEEGRRLFQKVDRPNLMLKVPSTAAGFPVIEELLGEGININVTLIFSLGQYIKSAQAYLRGLEKLRERGGNLRRIRSVASVFVSRIDTLVDSLLEEKWSITPEGSEKEALLFLRGKAAVVNSKLIFQMFREIFSGEKFEPLLAQGASVQRVLWGSTSTKNPTYSDVKYVDELIGSPTVNTMPEKTLRAFLDHGTIAETLTADVETARENISRLADVGIFMDAVCARLLQEGVIAFQESFDSLLENIQRRADRLTNS